MKYIVALFLILCIQFVQGQNQHKIDSLHKVYQSSKEHINQAEILQKTASQYIRSNPDTAIQLVQKSLELSQRLNNKKSQASGYKLIANCYYVKRKYDEAIKAFQKGLNIYKQLGDIKETSTSIHNIGNIYYAKEQFPIALTYFQKGIETLKSGNYHALLAPRFRALGLTYAKLNQYTQALKNYQESLKVYEELEDKNGVASIFLNMGVVYKQQLEHQLARKYYKKGLIIARELDDKQEISKFLNNIGNTYISEKNNEKALVFFEESLEIAEELKNNRGIAVASFNIGTIYQEQKKYVKALEYYEKSLAISKKIKSKYGQATNMDRMSQVFLLKQQYDKSLEYAQKSLALAEQIKSLLQINKCQKTLYSVYKSKGDYINALKYHELAKESSDSLFNVDKSKAIANLEAKTELVQKEKEITLLNKNQELLEKDNKLQHIEAERQKNAKLALEKQAEADQLMALARQEKDKRKQDSLQSLAQKTQLEADKLKAHEKQLEAESKARKMEIIKEREAKEFQQYINYLVIVGLLSLVIFAFFIYRSRQKERNAKNQIQHQKEELQHQKEELQVMNEELHQQAEEITVQRDYIEDQNKSLNQVNKMLTGNIRVARTIQDAILPYEDKFQSFFQEYFIFNKPRDIVSGDFYWLEKVENQMFLVVADATGHGVSGGFMSMIGSMMLDRIIVNYKISEPAQILTYLHQEIRKALKQDISHNQSGMDLSLVRITPHKEAFEVCFAGAKNDLLYVDAKAQKIQAIKASRKSIGGEQNEAVLFKQDKIILTNNAVLYLGSDGLEDQNDLNRKRFGKNNLITFFQENAKESLPNQNQKLENTLSQYMKDTEQRDDILWLGVKL